MVLLNRGKPRRQKNEETEDDFFNYAHKRVVEFRPHCYVQQLALAEAKQFDEMYALAHYNPVLGEEESEA